MNKLEAGYLIDSHGHSPRFSDSRKLEIDIASPAVAHGLELSGPNLEFSQTQELIENARSIAFFGRVKGGIEKFADYTGSLGKKISPRNLMLLGGIGVTAVAVACGGGSKDNADQVSAKPDVPAAPAVVRTIETTSTPAPAVKAEAPKLTPISLDQAKPILGIQTSSTTIEEVKKSIDDVYTKYPNLVYISQGVTVDKDRGLYDIHGGMS